MANSEAATAPDPGVAGRPGNCPGGRLGGIAFAAAGVARAADEDELFRVLQESCGLALTVDAMTFGLYDPAEHTIHFLSATDRGEPVEESVEPVAGRPAEWVIREQRTLVTLSSSDPRARGASPMGTGRLSESIIRVPLMADDEVLGLLTVQSYEPDAYDDQDVEVVEILAANAATALLNLRFRRELQQKVADEQEARETLAQATALHQALIEHSHDLVAVVEPDGVLAYVSPSSHRLLGLEPSQLIGEQVFEFIRPEEQDPARESFRRVLAGEPEAPLRLYHFRHADGGWRALELVSRDLLDHPAISGIIFNARDVTDRLEAEARSEATLRRLQAAQAVAKLGDWEMDLENDAVTWSAEMYRIHGVPSGTPLYRWTVLDLIHPDDREQVMEAVQRARHEGEAYEVDYRIMRSDDDVRHIHARGLYVLDEEGRPTRSFGTCQDVTELHRTEEALRATEERMRLFLGQMPAVLWLTDPELTFTWSDGAGLDLLGQDPKEQTGMSLQEYFCTNDSDFMPIAMHRRALQGERVSYEMSWQGRTFESHVEPLRDEHDEVVGTLGFAVDVTERRMLEQRLRDAQRMEAIGRLAGGVAHDFNNILTVIDGHANLLEEELHEADPVRVDVEEVRKATRRASDLTRQLLAFSRRQVLKPRVIDVNQVVRQLELMLQRLIGEDVKLGTGLDEEVGRVEVDPSQFEQVLMNLAANARDAMPEGGTLTVGTSNAEITQRMADRFPYKVESGDYVRVRVEDTGHGMEPEVVQSIFEPFFTTKEAGRGTGLGLATVYGIVKQSGGYIWVDSRPGDGTRFDIYLPRVAAEAVSPPPRQERQNAGGGTETILLVEDETAVRTLTRRVLERKGYRVLEAANGREALLLCEQHRGEIDLLITDVVMPEMSGTRLVERLRETAPELHPLFMSGYTEDEVLRRGIVADEVPFLQKPFTPETLVRTVRRVLDSLETEEPQG